MLVLVLVVEEDTGTRTTFESSSWEPEEASPPPGDGSILIRGTLLDFLSPAG